MTRYAPFHLEIAACLWEAVLTLRDRPAADPDTLERALAIRRTFDRLGAETLRPIILSWTATIERAWQQLDDDCPFGLDWAYIGRWLAESVDWSHPHHPVLLSDATEQDAAQAGPTGIEETPSSGPTDIAGRDDHLALLVRARAAGQAAPLLAVAYAHLQAYQQLRSA